MVESQPSKLLMPLLGISEIASHLCKFMHTRALLQYLDVQIPIGSGQWSLYSDALRAAASLFGSKPNGPGSLLKRIRPSEPIK